MMFYENVLSLFLSNGTKEIGPNQAEEHHHGVCLARCSRQYSQLLTLHHQYTVYVVHRPAAEHDT